MNSTFETREDGTTPSGGASFGSGSLDITTMSQLVSSLLGANAGIQQLRSIQASFTFPPLTADNFHPWYDTVIDHLSVHSLSSLITHPFSEAIHDPDLLDLYGDSAGLTPHLEKSLRQFCRHLALQLMKVLPAEDRSILSASRDRLDPHIIMRHLTDTYQVQIRERLRRYRAHMRDIRLSTAGSMKAYLTDFRTTANMLQSLGCTIHTPERLLELLFIGIDVKDYKLPIHMITMDIDLARGTKGLQYACVKLQEYADDKQAKPRRGIVAHVATADTSPVCAFCGKAGHFERTCWQKHPCSKCGEKGHGHRLHLLPCKDFLAGNCAKGSSCLRKHGQAGTLSSRARPAPRATAHVAARSAVSSAPATNPAPPPVSAPATGTAPPSAPAVASVCDFCSIPGHSRGVCPDYIYYRSQVSAFRRKQVVTAESEPVSNTGSDQASTSFAMAVNTIPAPPASSPAAAPLFSSPPSAASSSQSPPESATVVSGVVDVTSPATSGVVDSPDSSGIVDSGVVDDNAAPASPAVIDVAAIFYTEAQLADMLASPESPATLGTDNFDTGSVFMGMGTYSRVSPPSTSSAMSLRTLRALRTAWGAVCPSSNPSSVVFPSLLPVKCDAISHLSLATPVPVCIIPPTGDPVDMHLPLVCVGTGANFPMSHLVKPAHSPVASSVLMDSGASHHMTPKREALVNYRTSTNGSRGVNTAGVGAPPLDCAGIGDLYLRTVAGATVVLENVWHVPALRVSLFSTNLALSRGYTSASDKAFTFIKQLSTDTVILTGSAKPGSVLHWLDATIILPADLPRADFAGNLRV
jgi:hypothetical protein